VPVVPDSRSDSGQMRVDRDAAFRTREAAKSAARDSPNILAWGSADVLLDGLFAAETGEPLPGPSATSRACVPSPGCIVIAGQRAASGRSTVIAVALFLGCTTSTDGGLGP
jgi:hypothetical protein